MKGIGALGLGPPIAVVGWGLAPVGLFGATRWRPLFVSEWCAHLSVASRWHLWIGQSLN